MRALEQVAIFPGAATTDPFGSEDRAACKRILVPLDGTSSAEEIFPYVETFAKGFDAEVILLRVVPSTGQRFLESIPAGVPGMAIPSESQIDAMGFQIALDERAALKYLMGVKRRMLRAGITSRCQVVEGIPSTAILEYARDTDTSLIAMATHAHGGLTRLMLGSVADDVLRNLPDVPMLLIHCSEPLVADIKGIKDKEFPRRRSHEGRSAA